MDSTNHRSQSVAGNLQLQNDCECENAVFDLRLVEAMGAKPADRKGQLYLLKKNVRISGLTHFKLELFES